MATLKKEEEKHSAKTEMHSRQYGEPPDEAADDSSAAICPLGQVEADPVPHYPSPREMLLQRLPEAK